MTGTKTEMAFLKFTRNDFEDMVMREVKARYPFLSADTRWEWEDIDISTNILSPDTAGDKVVLELIYSKREESLDTPTKVVYVTAHEVCR